MGLVRTQKECYIDAVEELKNKNITVSLKPFMIDDKETNHIVWDNNGNAVEMYNVYNGDKWYTYRVVVDCQEKDKDTIIDVFTQYYFNVFKSATDDVVINFKLF